MQGVRNQVDPNGMRREFGKQGPERYQSERARRRAATIRTGSGKGRSRVYICGQLAFHLHRTTFVRPPILLTTFSYFDHRNIQDHDFFHDFIFRLPLHFHPLLRRTLGCQRCIRPTCDLSTQRWVFLNFILCHRADIVCGGYRHGLESRPTP
jgi:hypothetical protein